MDENKRTIHYIDVSKMSKKELCDTLGMKYVPWYKDSLLWLMILVFSMPSIMILANTFRS